jgi:uncharacterized surface protein with fasciclin (FAS1) repeats
MKLHHVRRNAGVAAAVLTLSVTLAACGDEDDKSGDSSGSDDKSMTAEGPGAQTFGDGCAEVPADGAGSFDGMVKDPVATAASNNPILTTLVTAVGAVDGLGDTLNGAEGLTVFAPFNGAFAEIPEADLNALVEGGMADGQDSTLYKILAHHVVGTNADTEAVAGDQETLAGDSLTIAGDENGMTVTDGNVTANVICGNIPTANATVYVIDKVLTGVK